jgi:hypothetical protein
MRIVVLNCYALHDGTVRGLLGGAMVTAPAGGGDHDARLRFPHRAAFGRNEEDRPMMWVGRHDGYDSE